MSKKIAIITLGVIALVAVAGAAVYVNQQRQDKGVEKVRQEEQVATLPEKPEIDTSDWKVYRNEDLGISFKYPKEWGEVKSKISYSPFNETPYTFYWLGEKLTFVASKGDLFLDSEAFTPFKQGRLNFEEDPLEDGAIFDVKRLRNNNGIRYMRYFYFDPWGSPPLYQKGLGLKFILPLKKYDSLKINPTLIIELPEDISSNIWRLDDISEEVVEKAILPIIQKINDGSFHPKIQLEGNQLDLLVQSIKFINDQ